MLRRSTTGKIAWNSSALRRFATSHVALALAGLILSRAQAPAQGNSGYVDSSICAGCHQEIAKSYRLTGMGRSFYSPRPESTVEDYTAHNSFYHATSDRYYTMFERGGKLYQRRHQIGYGGQETNVMEKQVDYVVGSGIHAHTYLHRTAENKLVELPVSWYAEKGGYWAMSPGYDRRDQQDFRRAIPSDCMFCHNGYPESPKGSVSDEAVFSTPLPEGIDCQRCHGPGRAHVDAAGSGRASADAIRRGIVNPARLDRDRQLDVCMQCHLETTSLPLPNAIRRYDRGPYSYRPGEPLGNNTLYFDRAPGTGYDDRFEVAHQGYRLRKSACFRASRMTCTTCHNPHQGERGQQAVQRYVSICRNCHATSHASGIPAGGATCLDCHMPKRRTDDVVHVVMTDHYIQRRKPDRDLLAEFSETAEKPYQGEVVPYDPPLPRQTADDLYLAVAQVQHGSNLQTGIPRLEKAIARSKPVGPEFYFELGNAYAQAGKPNEAVRWLQEALRHRPDFHPALAKLAAVLVTSGMLSRAVDAGERAAFAQPSNTVVLTNLGNAHLQKGNIDRARQVLQKAIHLNPDLPDARNLLGLAALRKGERPQGESFFREAIRIQPDFAEAHNNLANLLAGSGDYRQAAYHFEKAIASNPQYVEAHHSYGLILALMRSSEKAVAELEEAARLDPQAAQIHVDLGDVLVANGRSANAAGEYRRAIELQPELHEAHLALGTILARTGAVSEARAHFQKAAESPDPAIRQAALKALR